MTESQGFDPCPKERFKQKDISPGIVGDGESIVLIIIDPLQWQNGKLIPAAFSKTRLKSCSLSVARGNHSTLAEINSHVVHPQLAKPGRRLVGSCKTQCSIIRSIIGDQDSARLFCVIDDGLDDYPAHAVIGFSDHTKSDNFWSRNQRTAAIANLSLAFERNGILPLTECFST